MEGIKPENENGNIFDKYRWTQNKNDVSIYVPIPSDVNRKSISVRIFSNQLIIKVEDEIVVEGIFFERIKVENSIWSIVNHEIVVEIDKVLINKTDGEWWLYCFEGEPKIDPKEIRPDTVHISDMDEETRMSVAKMMYEQELKDKCRM